MKKLITLPIFIIAILFSCSIIAQQMKVLRGNYQMNFPEKIQKLVADPLPAGTYTIGSGGDFPTIDSAFNKLSVEGIAGQVTLELIDTLYTAPTTTYGFLLNGPIPGANKDNRVTIKPEANKNVIIKGNGLSVLTFRNTSYLILEGKNLSDTVTLTIHAQKNSQFWTNNAVKFVNNSNHNVVQNITVISDEKKRGSGIEFSIGDPTSLYAPDSNLIQNNYVKRAGVGIYISGYIFDTGPIKKAIGNIISGNFVGSETDTLITWGIQIENSQNTIVENNEVWNISYNNDDILGAALGINSYFGIESFIRNNLVHNIFDSCSEAGAIGISLTGQAGERGSNNLVYNNMIYDIHSSSKISTSYTVGIHMWHQTNPKIYFNSVYLSGKGANPYGSAALYIETACTNVEVKNNILVNTRDESSNSASSIYDYSTSNLTSDYNDLYYEPNEYNCFVRIGGAKYTTLTDWQAIGKDLHSISEMPHFVAPYLHIDESIPTNLEKRGLVITDIDTDFDGDLRDANLPDIGADEFNGKVVPGSLTGAYSVGTYGYFTSIDSAFKRLSLDGIAASVTLELIDTLYIAPTTTTGFFLNGPIPGADQNNRITIKPAEHKNVTIKGSGESVLQFLNTSYLTLDGVNRNGFTTLTIHALYNSQFTWNNAVEFLSNSDHNIVQNLTALSDDYTRLSFSIGFWVRNFAGNFAPDSNLIQNNFVKKSGYAGLFVSGLRLDMTRSKEAVGNVIKGNFVGSETDSLITWGIQVECCKNAILENNIVQNLRYNLKGLQLTHGINCFWSSGTIIRNNIVHNIGDNGSQNGATGILLSGGSVRMGSNNMVYNNMIYDIRNSSKNSESCAAGILMWQQNSPQIYFNSVYLNGKGSSPSGSAPLYIEGACSNVIAKNNILVNTRDESPYCASSIYNYSTSNLTSDNNDLYYESNQYNCLVKAGGIDYKTLTDWQIKNEDLNSITEMPNFVSGGLHIDEAVSTNLESNGTPIVGIDIDFDGDARDSNSPDIGADEFNGTVVGVNDKDNLPLVFNLEQNYPNPFNPNTTIKYSIPKQSYVTLKVYDILGGEVATLVNEEKHPGNYETVFNPVSNNQQLSSGIYFYKITAGDFTQTKKMILLK